MAPYMYGPLDESRRDIRIMILHPGSGNDPVLISLENDSDDRRLQDHAALSYTWGSPTDPVELKVVGMRAVSGVRLTRRRKSLSAVADLRRRMRHLHRLTELGTISITRNLAEALPYLRLPYVP